MCQDSMDHYKNFGRNYWKKFQFYLQVEVKTFCFFLTKTHLKLSDPSVNIPQNIHKLASSRSLPDLFVICLPHVTVQSAGHKAVSCLQEIPIISMEGSLVGKIPVYNIICTLFFTLCDWSDRP